MSTTLDIPRDAAAPCSAREGLRCVSGRFRRDDADLLVTELVTNAVRHGAGDSVRVIFDALPAGGLHCGVLDDGDGFAGLIAPGAEGGFGLFLVDHLSVTWGVHEGSTHVWFELGAE